LQGVATAYGTQQGMFWKMVVVHIIYDIFLAIMSNAWQKRVCVLQNRLYLESNAFAGAALQNRIMTYKLYRNLFNFMIGFSVLVKCFFFYNAYMKIDGVLMGMFACYLIAGLLHVYYTGYFLYTSRFNYLIWKEYDKHIVSGGTQYIANQLTMLINNDGINLNETIVGKQRIVKREQSYFLETCGILEDSELHRLIVRQASDVARTIVAREGIKVQLQQLQLSPRFH
jgi:hypothetical protein